MKPKMKSTALLSAATSIAISTGALHGQEVFDAPAPYPYGLTTDGNHLWISSFDTQEIHKLDQDGAVLHSFDFNHGTPRGLTLNNGVLYVATVNRVYRIDPEDGAYLSHFSSPDQSDPEHQGLAFGNGKLWISSRGSDDRIFGVDPMTGQPQVDFDAPGTDARGITFHNGSLWNLDSNSDMIYEIDPADGSVLSSHAIPLRDPRGLTYHNGSFLQVDRTLNQLMRFEFNSPYSEVYVAHSQWPIPGTQLTIPYLSSHPVDQSNNAIERILVYQHGIQDNACEYFARARYATKLAGELDNTLIVSLQLLDDNKLTGAPPADMIYWTGSRFWGAFSAGNNAPYPRNEKVSAFTVLDELLAGIVNDDTLFPNLTDIVISGHSGGGQFANRYAATSPFEDTMIPENRDIAVRYIVMNPGNFLYFNDRRYDPNTLDLNNDVVDFIVPPNPVADYNDYGFGLADLYSYPSQVGVNGILLQYPERTVVYLHGDADTDVQGIDNRPESVLQGVNRYERGLIYFEHLKDHFGANNLVGHTQDVVPGVDHDGGAMIASDYGRWYHFTPPVVVVPPIYSGDILAKHQESRYGYQGNVTVMVIDGETGRGVEGATVTGRFSGAYKETVTGVTNQNGEVILTTRRALRRPREFRFDLTEISHPDYLYDPESNVESSETVRF